MAGTRPSFWARDRSGTGGSSVLSSDKSESSVGGVGRTFNSPFLEPYVILAIAAFSRLYRSIMRLALLLLLTLLQPGFLTLACPTSRGRSLMDLKRFGFEKDAGFVDDKLRLSERTKWSCRAADAIEVESEGLGPGLD